MDAGELWTDEVGVTGPHGALLSGVTLRARPGRMLAVTGSSGSGKTTLLSVLGGLLRPDSGAVAYAGQEVGTRDGEPRRGTALVLQTYGLVPSLTAEENVAVALRARAVAPEDANTRARAALDRVGSSASSTSGCTARTRATATRCSCPPESSVMSRSARSPTPTRSRAARARAPASTGPIFRARRATATFSSAVRLGTRP